MPRQQNEAENVGRKRSKISGSGSRGKKRAKVVIADSRRDENNVPVVSNGRELVGKVIEHFCYLDEEDKQGWHRGVVLATPRKDKFEVCYNDFPDVIYSRQLYKGFKAGYVRLVELKPKKRTSLVQVFVICIQMGSLMKIFGGMQKLLT